MMDNVSQVLTHSLQCNTCLKPLSIEENNPSHVLSISCYICSSPFQKRFLALDLEQSLSVSFELRHKLDNLLRWIHPSKTLLVELYKWTNVLYVLEYISQLEHTGFLNFSMYILYIIYIVEQTNTNVRYSLVHTWRKTLTVDI